MKLTFLYQPVDDLTVAARFHRDSLGLDEAWREGEEAIAFWLPDRTAQIMISTTPQPPGPMFCVDDLDAWIAEHAEIPVLVEKYAIPGGAVAGFSGPAANVFYVFDQPDA